jgi:hypothetical protein
LHFGGFSSNKNPAAKIFVDGALVGNGTLSQGFSVSFAENRVGEHKVRIEWSSMIDSKTFKIDTSLKKQFDFKYDKGGFGYEFRIIK